MHLRLSSPVAASASSLKSPKSPVSSSSRRVFENNNTCRPSLSAGCRQSKKCWACWESDDCQRNPLIRTCRYCKNRDLQTIHHRCIQSYLTNMIINHYQLASGLLYPQTVANIPEFNERFPQAPLNLLDEHLMGWLTSLPAFQRQHLRSIAVESDQDATSENFTTGTDDPLNDTGMEQRPLLFENSGSQQPMDPGNIHSELMRQWAVGEEIALLPLKLRCQHCLDQYLALALPVSSFKVMRSDLLLKILFIAMTLCVVILWGSCAVLSLQAFNYERIRNEPLILKGWMTPVPVDVRTWAGTMLIFFTSIYIASVVAVLRICRGYWQVVCFEKPEIRSTGVQSDLI